MGDELEMNKHFDCAWLIEIKEGVYCCCDSRSLNKGKEFNKEEVMQEACSFFHPKKVTQKLKDDKKT